MSAALDLAVALEEVYDARSKWYDIGIMLKIPVSTLNSIRAQYHDPKDALREMLTVWLNSVDPKPTWRALVDVLQSKVVAEAQLADQLERKWCHTPVTVPAQGKHSLGMH